MTNHTRESFDGKISADASTVSLAMMVLVIQHCSNIDRPLILFSSVDSTKKQEEEEEEEEEFESDYGSSAFDCFILLPPIRCSTSSS